MLFNVKTNEVKKEKDCIGCEHFDAKLMKCNGINVQCFQYDKLTNTIIDGITGMPIDIKTIKGE